MPAAESSATLALLSIGSLCLVVQVGLARAQERDLRTDLDKLNVRHTTEHYELAGTVADERLIDYGRCLEYIHREFTAGFGRLLEVKDAGTRDAEGEGADRFRVIILDKQKEYDELTQAYFGARAEFTRGMCVAGAKLLIVSDDGDRDKTYEVLFHEAFHQFARRHVPAIPVWLNEGLATYYGLARPTKQGIVLDRPNSRYFRVVRDATSAKQLIPLEQLMSMSPRDFYDHREVLGISWSHSTLAYAQAYTLIVYILSDPAGAGTLREYIRRLAAVDEGSDVVKITTEVFPPKLLQAMTPKWLARVQRGG